VNVDELPLELLGLLAAGAWAVWVLVVSSETLLNRPQGVRHRKADDHVEDDGAEQEAAKPDEKAEKGGLCIGHGRSVHPAPVALPPGIPSITERLDRWKD